MTGSRASVAGLWLALCALAVLAGLAVVQPAHGQDAEDYAFRVAVRVHPNDTHLEFGIQRLDQEGEPQWLHLEQHRFVALGLDHHRWLQGDASYSYRAPYYDPDSAPAHVENARVRVVARLHPTRGLFQFGAQYELDKTQLPDNDIDDYAPPVFDRKQFFPNDIDHHRWLYTGEMRFTRVWSPEGTMEQAPTMEDDGTQPEVEPAPELTTAESCLAQVHADADAMVADECYELMAEYCENHPSHPWCIGWREDE